MTRLLSEVLFAAFLSLSLLIPPGCTQPKALDPLAMYDFSSVTALIQDGVETLPLAGASLLLIENDWVIYEAVFGAYTLETTVPIASASKWLSATAIMTLVDDGLIDLDAPISTYLPNFTSTAGTITTRQLLSHTSGMSARHACLALRHITLEQCVNQIAATPLLAPPGAQFFYGENSFQVAGRIAEVVTNQSWAELFDERIGGPLRMVDTTYGESSNPLLGGGAISSLHDYGNLMRLHLDEGVFDGEAILSPAAIREMRVDQTAGARLAYTPYDDGRRYGLGNWVDVQDSAGAPLQNSSQGLFGFTPWIDWERGTSGVFLVLDSGNRVQPLVTDIQRAVRDAIDAGRHPPTRHHLPLIF
jgi:CubicO group peptidase (beta-lactamase class C family)